VVLPIIALLSLAGVLGVVPAIQSAHANPASSNAAPGGSGLTWQATTGFPLNGTFVSCSGYGGYVYCLADDQVHYASISSTGVGTWSNSTPYPGTASYYPPACAASAGYIYCVGGTNGNPSSVTDAVYYAPLSSSGVGKWAQTTDYPTRIFSASCFASGGYLYCVGGEETIGAILVASVYYAPISSSGVGGWTATTQYPIQIDDTNCVTSNGSAYCTGGVESVQGQSPTSATYYATVSPSGGLGAWAPTTDYPGGVQPGACVAAAGDIYCMGGSVRAGNVDDVNYATMSSTGIGAWTSTTSYPSGAGYPNYDGCVASGSYVYCVGSNSEGGPSTPVYYAEVSAASSTSSTSSTSSSSSTSQLMVSAQDLSGHALEGYTAVLNQSGTTVVATGYTPATFNLVDGQAYAVGVDGYGSCRFDHWLATGSTVAIQPISITNDTQITAVFNCSATTTSSSSSSSSSASSSSSISTSSSSRSSSSSTRVSSSTTVSSTSHSNDSTTVVNVPPPTTSASSSSASRSLTTTTSKTLDSSSLATGTRNTTTTAGGSSTTDTATPADTQSQDSPATTGLVGIIALVAAGIVVIGAAIALSVRKR
jgi:hypothetical protein